MLDEEVTLAWWWVAVGVLSVVIVTVLFTSIGCNLATKSARRRAAAATRDSSLALNPGELGAARVLARSYQLLARRLSTPVQQGWKCDGERSGSV